MHAITILHRILSTSFPEIHAKRLASLLAAVEAIVSDSRLTLSDMGRWLSGPVGNEFWARGTGDFPGRKDVAAKPFFQENRLVRAIVEQMLLPNAKSPNLAMPNAVQLNKVLTSEIQNVVQGKKSAKQALDDAAAEWNKILAKYQK